MKFVDPGMKFVEPNLMENVNIQDDMNDYITYDKTEIYNCSHRLFWKT